MCEQLQHVLPYEFFHHAFVCHVTSRHVTSRHVTSRHVTSRHVTSRHVTSRSSGCSDVEQHVDLTVSERRHHVYNPCHHRRHHAKLLFLQREPSSAERCSVRQYAHRKIYLCPVANGSCILFYEYFQTKSVKVFT